MVVYCGVQRVLNCVCCICVVWGVQYAQTHTHRLLIFLLSPSSPSQVPQETKQLSHLAIPNMQHSVIAALQSIKNPRVACHRLHILIKLLTDQLRTMSGVERGHRWGVEGGTNLEFDATAETYISPLGPTGAPEEYPEDGTSGEGRPSISPVFSSKDLVSEPTSGGSAGSAGSGGADATDLERLQRKRQEMMQQEGAEGLPPAGSAAALQSGDSFQSEASSMDSAGSASGRRDPMRVRSQSSMEVEEAYMNIHSGLHENSVESEVKLPDVEQLDEETLPMMTMRWAKLEKDFYHKKKDRFDISKIPDIYDCIKYDIVHNKDLVLRLTGIAELFVCAKCLADVVMPQVRVYIRSVYSSNIYITFPAQSV